VPESAMLDMMEHRTLAILQRRSEIRAGVEARSDCRNGRPGSIRGFCGMAPKSVLFRNDHFL